MIEHPIGSITSADFDFDIDIETAAAEESPARKARRAPSCKTLRTLNAIQLDRLERLISQFKNRDKKLVYVNGLQHDDDAQLIWVTRLKRDRNGVARIIRNAEKLTMALGRNYNKAFSKEFGPVVDEHSALDLFLTACKRLPGFEEASGRRLKERPFMPVTKAAVPPIPYDGSEPPLVFESPLLDQSEILPSAMVNALAIGSTGSGKTVSFMLPTLMSMLTYRLSGGKTASLLVIDPKVELLSRIEDKLAKLGELDRLVVLGRCDPINYFQEGDGLSVSDRFEKVKSFVPVAGTSAEDNRWQIFAEQLILSFLKDDQKFADVCGLPLLESVAALVTGDDRYLVRNQWVALRKLLLLGLEDGLKLRHICDVYDLLTGCVGLTKLDRPFVRYVTLKDTDQYFYNARGALTIVDSLGSEEIEHILDLSVRRGLPKKNRTDVAALVECGAVLVFQPRNNATHDLVGGALKSLFFRSVMEREDMTRPMGYFCDEFQRYITTDPETGEHAFLDRCRAYRVNSFLATQSMAALLAATSRRANAAGTLDSILVNTPTKVCFRTTDRAAVVTMSAFIPKDPRSDQHVLNCRPPSALKTGEYYFALEHNWGRTRYELPKIQCTSGRVESNMKQGG
jgi:hypothetical protein